MQGAGTQGTLNEHEVISLDSDDDDEGEKKGISKDDSSSEYDDEDDVVVLPNNSNSGSRGGKSSSSTEEEEDDDDVVVVAARAGSASEAPQAKRARTAVQEEPPPSTSPLPRGAECVCPRTELADERCAVCLMPLGDADTLVRAVACRHMFCWRCIDPWLSRYKKVCPVCKGPLSKAALQRVRVVDSPAKQPRPPPPPPTSGTD